MTASPTSRHAVTFVLITVFLDMVGFGLITPVLPRLIEQVGGMDLIEAAAIAGWMFAAFSICQFAFSPLMGNLSDRYGRRPLLLIAVFGLGVDYLFHAFAPSIFWLFIGRAFAGICGSSYVIANAYIADITSPDERAKAYGLMAAAFGAGFVLGPAIGGILGELGPRVPFYVAALISFLNLAYGWCVLPETLAPENRRRFEWARSNPFGAFKVFRVIPGLLPMSSVLAVYFFASAVYPAIWTFWGIAKFRWTEAVVGVTLAAFGLIMAGFQGFLTGPAVARWGEYRVALIGLLCGALACFGYGIVGSFALIIALMCLHGPEGFVHPMLTALMSRAVPEDQQGELQGGMSAIINLAMLCGTVFFAQIFHFFMTPEAPFQSPDVGYHLAGALIGLSFLMFLWLVPKPAQSPDPVHEKATP